MMRLLSRFVFLTIVGLVGAAIVHLAIIFLLPQLGTRTAARVVQAERLTSSVQNLDLLAERGVLQADLVPYLRHAGCRFDLDEGVFRMTGSGRLRFWSLSVHDLSGRVLFSADDSSATGRRLDLAVANPLEFRRLNRDAPEALVDSILADFPDREGYVVVRMYVPDESWEPLAEEFRQSIQCGPRTF